MNLRCHLEFIFVSIFLFASYGGKVLGWIIPGLPYHPHAIGEGHWIYALDVPKDMQQLERKSKLSDALTLIFIFLLKLTTTK